MTDNEIRGTRWRVEFGEIGEREQFRVGYVGSEAWEAYFPIASLYDLTNVLVGAQALPAGQFFRGATWYQAEKLQDWQKTVSVQPLSYIPAPPLMTLYSADLAEMILLLQQLAAKLGTLEPEDWDNGELDFTVLDARYARIGDTGDGSGGGSGPSGDVDGGSAALVPAGDVDGGSA